MEIRAHLQKTELGFDADGDPHIKFFMCGCIDGKTAEYFTLICSDSTAKVLKSDLKEQLKELKRHKQYES